MKNTTDSQCHNLIIDIRSKMYLGKMEPGPGSSEPGTNTNRLLQIMNEYICFSITGGYKMKCSLKFSAILLKIIRV